MTGLTGREWEFPELTSWRRLPMYAVDRRADGLSLDGHWRFQLLPAPDAPLSDDWAQLRAPGPWTMQDTGDLPQYTNVPRPWPRVPAAVAPRRPHRRARARAGRRNR